MSGLPEHASATFFAMSPMLPMLSDEAVPEPDCIVVEPAVPELPEEAVPEPLPLVPDVMVPDPDAVPPELPELPVVLDDIVPEPEAVVPEVPEPIPVCIDVRASAWALASIAVNSEQVMVSDDIANAGAISTPDRIVVTSNFFIEDLLGRLNSGPAGSSRRMPHRSEA